MRKLVWIIGGLAVLWCAWWWLAATALERGTAGWLEARRAEGWQAELGAVSVAGFPLALNTRIAGASLADPASGVALEAEALDLSMPAYWPGDATLRLPHSPIRFSGPLGDVFLRTTQGRLALNLHPGPALQVEAMEAASGPWQVNLSQGNLLSATDLAAAMVQDPDDPARYHLSVTAAEPIPGDVLRMALKLPGDWPRVMTDLEADMSLAFAQPLDRTTLAQNQMAVRELEVRTLDLTWGPVSLFAEGVVAIDAAGIPDGDLSVTLQNWRQIMVRAEAMGRITATERARAELVLNALANMGGAPETLDLALRFTEGEMFLGPIPLGPAPRLTMP